MSLFFIIFFLIYGGMHLYAFLKAKTGLALGTTVSRFLIFFMLFMTFTPFIVRISERHGFDIFARLMSYTGYVWMSILFLFVVSSLAIDFFRLLTYAVEGIVQKNFCYLKPSGGFSFFIALILSVSISVYGYFEAGNIRTEKITVKTSGLPEHIGRLRIVQISDIHIGLIIRESRLKKILEQVKIADPDILVSTGDLVDAQINSLSNLSEFFKEVNPKYGKFAITGNHEFYAGLSQALGFIEQAGFTVLRGQGVSVEGIINIVGVDDPAGRHYNLFKDISEKELLLQFPKGQFTLLLKHRPLVDKNSLGLFDLQLSGHSHKGQIFPFSLFTKLYYQFDAGYSQLTNNSHLYVSRGSGTWGPPIRFLAPPEVTVIDIVREKD